VLPISRDELKALLEHTQFRRTPAQADQTALRRHHGKQSKNRNKFRHRFVSADTATDIDRLELR
jgi:hypothetical protein